MSRFKLDGLVEEHREEIDGYIEEIERLLGTRLDPGADFGSSTGNHAASAIGLALCMLFIDRLVFLRLTYFFFV